MMAYFQTPANSAFNYPHIIQHYTNSAKITDSTVKQSQNEAQQDTPGVR